MELEEAKKIVKEDLEHTKIANECGLSNNDFKKEIEATEMVLNHLTKQEKIIDLMARFIDTELSSEHLSKVSKIDVKPLETYRENIRQYFEKKAEEEN